MEKCRFAVPSSFLLSCLAAFLISLPAKAELRRSPEGNSSCTNGHTSMSPQEASIAIESKYLPKTKGDQKDSPYCFIYAGHTCLQIFHNETIKGNQELDLSDFAAKGCQQRDQKGGFTPALWYHVRQAKTLKAGKGIDLADFYLFSKKYKNADLHQLSDLESCMQDLQEILPKNHFTTAKELLDILNEEPPAGKRVHYSLAQKAVQSFEDVKIAPYNIYTFSRSDLALDDVPDIAVAADSKLLQKVISDRQKGDAAKRTLALLRKNLLEGSAINYDLATHALTLTGSRYWCCTDHGVKTCNPEFYVHGSYGGDDDGWYTGKSIIDHLDSIAFIRRCPELEPCSPHIFANHTAKNLMNTANVEALENLLFKKEEKSRTPAEISKRLQKQLGADPSEFPVVLSSSILDAAELGNEPMVEYLLKLEGAKPNDILIAAIKHGKKTTLKTLLKKINPDNSIPRGNSPLFAAVAKGDLKLLEILHKSGASLTYKGPRGTSALHIAFGQKDPAIIRYLLQNSPQLALEGDDHKVRPWHYWQMDDTEEGEEEEPEDEKTPIAKKISPEIEKILETLEAANISSQLGVHWKRGLSRHPDLITSVFQYKNGNILKKLIENKIIDADSKTNKGHSTLLIDSINQGNESLALALIQRGAQVKKLDESGYSPLFYAIAKGNLKIVKALMKKHAPTTIAAYKGNCVHAAAQLGHFEIAKYLLDLRPQLSTQLDESGKLPTDYFK